MCFIMPAKICTTGETLAAAALLFIAATGAVAANAYTALRVELSQDNLQWSQSLQVTPGSQLHVRVVAAYEGRGSLNGMAWVNFQPTISNWWGQQDQVLPFVSTGNQGSGDVAFDKPQDGQAMYGRIYPFATNAAGPSPGGFDTTLTSHVASVNGTRQCRIAQARTSNPIGTGPATGVFAFNNTNGAGGIVCAQPPAESNFSGMRSTLDAGIVLFKFGIMLDPSLTERTLPVELPLGGVSKFGTAQACAGWFTDTAQTAANVTYVPAYSRSALITVRGAVPAPGSCAVAALGCTWCFARRRRRLAFPARGE